MADSGGWPGDETVATQVMALPSAERQVLAAVAVVGQASLSESELAELIEIDDVRPLIDDLERRGLVKGDERKRYSLLGHIGDEIRSTDDALASGDQLMQYLTTLAKAGAMTPSRLVDDAEAILGLSEWAAENRQWASLLELVKTLQACFGIANRVQEWLALLERGRSAAHALGDQRSEVWVLQQMATAAQSAGDPAAAQHYLREAGELQRGRRPSASQSAGAGRTEAAERALPRLALWIAGLAVAAAAGTGVGYAVGADNGNVGTTTAPVSVTVTVNGHPVRTADTVTLPATTVVSVSTEVTTTTVTTTTVTTTPAIK